MRALGTIIGMPQDGAGETEVYSGILDYYDHWTEIDPRLAEHHDHLSLASDVFGHDIVNMATYVHEILIWLQPENIQQAQSVVSVGGMTESYLVSVRSACDAIAIALAYVACENPSQAPSQSLRTLTTWALKNERRVQPGVYELLSQDMEWFWNLRSLRDHLVHGGAYANIHCNRRQFNLWVYSPRTGWVTREPLLLLLKAKFISLIQFSNSASRVINKVITMPDDRLESRVVSGILIPALHRLVDIADNYADPSP